MRDAPHGRRRARRRAGRASWNGRATGWSRWERRCVNDAGGHRRGGAHPARAEAHAAGVEAGRRRLPGARWTRSSPPSPARCRRRSLTGLTPTDHGIVGNGWYFRDLGEVFLWRQHNKLVQGEKVWETARRAKPGFRAANLCWWYAMGASTDLTVTPRPIYHADGRKSPDCYTYPAAAARQPDRPAGRVPALPVLGADGEHQVDQVDRRRGEDRARQRAARPAARLPAAPRLRPPALRPEGPEAREGRAASSTRSLGDLIDHARGARRPGRGAERVRHHRPRKRPVEINRALRRAGLLNVYTQAGMEYLDPWTSRAFAVADHQIAHVYVANPADLAAPRARRSPRSTAWGRCSRARRWPPPAWPTSAPASSSSWPSATPGSPTTTGSTTTTPRTSAARSRSTASRATTPPSCSWTRTTRRAPSCAPAWRSARKTTGLRYVLSVVGLDASKYVKGTHGLLPPGDEDGPGVPVQREVARARPHRGHGSARPAAGPRAASRESARA